MTKFQLLIKQKKIETIMITVLLLGALLRFHNIDRQSLWGDEIGQVMVATKNIPELIVGVSGHLSPPVDYLIMHFFLKFVPAGEFFIRMPAAIFGIASILFIFLLGKQLFSAKIGLISAFLLAISPYDIYYSQEARMYSSFLFFTLVSFYTFLRFVETGKKCFFPWILSGILLIYTHYFGFFVLLIQFIFLSTKITVSSKLKIGNMDLSFIGRFITGYLIIALSFLGWLDIFLKQTKDGNRILWYGMDGNWRNFFWKPWVTFSGIGIATWLIILILLISIIYGLKKYFESTVIIIIWIFLPLLTTYILTITRGSVTTERNLIFILPAVLLLLSLGFLKISELIQSFFRKTSLLNTNININYSIFFILFIVLFLTLSNLSNTYDRKKDDWKGVSNYLMKNAMPGDDIIFLGKSPENFDFYYRGNATYSSPDTIGKFMAVALYNKNNTFNCTWIFIPGYSNAFWDTGQNNTNKSMILETLNKTSAKIKGLYSNNDERGLYKICQRQNVST